MAQASTALATRPPLAAPSGHAQRLPPPKSVGELLTRDQDTIDKLRAVATKFLPPERALRLAIAAVRRTPKLAQCDPATFMGAMMFATGLGLEPNTPLGHAYLIPYAKRTPQRDANGEILTDAKGRWLMDEIVECQFQIGYKGYIALAYRSPLLVDLTAEAVREGDRFVARKGTETLLSHEKNLTAERGEIIGAYCFTRLKDGQAFTVMTRSDLDKVRARSETFRSLAMAAENAQNDKARAKAAAKLAETPWQMWDDEMAAKSAIRRHVKQLPISVEMALAAEVDGGVGDAGVIDMKAMADPDQARAVIDGEAVPTTADDETTDAPMINRKTAPESHQIEHKPEQAINTTEPPPNDGDGQVEHVPARQPQRAATAGRGRLFQGRDE